MQQFNGTTAAQNLTLYALDGTELLVQSLLTCPFSALNFLLILRTSILHPNLKFILLCQSLSIFTRSATRFIICAFKLAESNVFWDSSNLHFVFGFCAFFRNYLAHVLVTERVMATLFVRNYEHWRRPYFSIFWFIIVTILAFANSRGSISSSNDELNFLLNILTWSVVFALALAECLIFLWIWRHNDTIFQNKFFTSHSLSERYQLAENIRTGRQLIPTLLLHFFNITIGTVVNWANYVQIFGPPKENKIFYELMSQLFYCTIASTNFLIELTMILYHPYLRRNFMGFLLAIKRRYCCIWCRSTDARISPSSSPSMDFFGEIVRMNIRGKNNTDLGLFPNNSNETEEYFNQLQKCWESADISRRKH